MKKRVAVVQQQHPDKSCWGVEIKHFDSCWLDCGPSVYLSDAIVSETNRHFELLETGSLQQRNGSPTPLSFLRL